jgi:hypothetical protein
MQIVIESLDWRRLSSGARDELLQLLEEPSAPAPAKSRAMAPADNSKGFRWRVPFDLTPDLARKLLRGLTGDQVTRLKLFAKGNGRVSLKAMLAATKGADLHVLSAFEGAVTRKLRRLVGDENRIISLIMWDYDAEKWDKGHSELVDGVFYVSAPTVQALKKCFGGK